MLNGLIFSNIWIALGALFLSYQSYVLLDEQPQFDVLAFVFVSTWFSYNFQRFVQQKDYSSSQSIRHQWILNNSVFFKVSVVVGFLTTLLLSLFLVYQHMEKIFVLIVVGLISLLYAWKKWREVMFVKIFLISISWALMTVVFPLYGKIEIKEIEPLFWSVFLFIFSITIPFDIRDMQYDKDKITIPLQIGIVWSKVLAIILLWVSFFLLGQVFFLYTSIFFYLLTSIIILLSEENRQEYFYSLLVDGLIIFHSIIYITLK